MRARGHVLPLAPEAFLLPLSSGVTNPMGRLGGSEKSCGQVLRVAPPVPMRCKA
jgi:hypothetical protein